MILKKLHQQSAAVLLTVIVITMVLAVVVIGMMSLNVSQVKSSQSVIDDVKAEYLALSSFYEYHAEMTLTGGSTSPESTSETLDNKNFDIDRNVSGSNVITNISFL